MFKKIVALLFFCGLTGCMQTQHPLFWQEESPMVKASVPTVAVLLPLSGESATVGEHLRNATMMAAFEHQKTPLKVLFFDTKSTEKGAEDSYRWALAQKPDLVLGPVFSKEVKALANFGLSKPILTFTSDTTLVNSDVGTMAVTIPEQIHPIVRHACASGQYKLAVLSPENKTGEIAMDALAEEIKTCPRMTLEKVSLYPADTMNFTEAVSRVAPRLISSKKKTELSEEDLAELALPITERAGIDAVILFEEGIKLRQLLSLLAFYDIGPKDLPVYGLTVVEKMNDSNTNFVYFSDLDETNYSNFSRQYKDQFGKAPLRIASQIYDAMGFVFKEASEGRSVSLDNLRRQDSYWGVDGLVRLNEDGTNRRALQLKQKRGNRSILIEPAESFFEKPVVNDWIQLPTTESADLT